MAIDPFTRASGSYQAATRSRLPFKSGSAYEGWAPRQGRSLWSYLAGLLVLAALGFFVVALVDAMGAVR